jgi:hypothetical protein
MAQEINDGGPAFPRDHMYEGHNGMTLRDYFAAKALMGLLSCNVDQDYDEETLKRENYAAYCDNWAESAYDMADAMLRARLA